MEYISFYRVWKLLLTDPFHDVVQLREAVPLAKKVFWSIPAIEAKATL